MRFIFLFTISFIVISLPEFAHAAGSDTVIGNMLCTVVGWEKGSTGRGIATLAMIIVGIMALMNKISWGFVLLHIVGTALMVGASSIVSSLNAGGSGCL